MSVNPPVKKILSLVKDKQGQVYSTDSLKWTPDDKLLICCSEKLFIFNILLAQRLNFSPGQNIFTTTMDTVLSLNDVSGYSLSAGVLNHQSSFLHLKDVERQKLVADPLLIDDGIYQFSGNKIIKKAECSSFSWSGGYLIACVTYEARVFIFSKVGHDFKTFEVTQYIKKQMTSKMSFPTALKGSRDLQDHTELVHNMSTVEILWSQLFTFEKCAPFFLLITGSRNGRVQIWRVESESRRREDQFVWQTSDQYQSEVMSLAWQTRNQAKGLLAIGYVDGSIRCLEVSVSYDQRVSITVKEIMTDLFCDNLSVTCMGFGKSNEGTEILLACKLYSLHLYSVSDSTGVVRNRKHFDVDSVLPITSMCLTGPFGVISPQESAVIEIEVQESSGEIIVVQRRQDFESSSERPNVPRFSNGAALHPSVALCFSLQRTEVNVQRHVKRRRDPGKQVVFMSVPFSLTPEQLIRNLEGQQISTKGTILNLCLHIMELAQGTPKLNEISDILEILQNMPGVKGLQVALALMKFLKPLFQFKNDSDSEPEWLSLAYNEALRRRLSQHAAQVWSELPESMSEQDNKILGCLRTHWNPEIKAPELEAGHEYSLCAVCGDRFLPDRLLTVKCSKGHTANVCCLSSQPCQDFSVRTCETCGACALSLDSLSDCIVLKDKLTCTICGGCLRESSWT